MTGLSQSVDAVSTALKKSDLGAEATVRELLTETTRRRTLDLSDLTPADQAGLISSRAQMVQPSYELLMERLTDAANEGRQFVAKFGIDPTAADVHLGHTVPMIVLSRFQRMGHKVVFIVGDLTAKIGDPSGLHNERPALSDDDIASNLVTYRDQIGPFFDFKQAEFHHNSEWLRQITLPRLIEIAAEISVSMPLQREDFRKRLDSGHGLSLAELLYSVVMALDSVETNCDVEVGGVDQFLNMQMCRKVMDICGLSPEVVVANPLIEGTDFTGAKMSKSSGNYIPLTAMPDEIFGKIMSMPDRLVEPYFRALSEWTDSELAVVKERVDLGRIHPVDLKKLLAGEVTAAIHGVEAALTARAEFVVRYSERTFDDVTEIPTVADPAQSVAEVVKGLGFAKSNSHVRRVAEQDGLRLVLEARGHQEKVLLSPDDIHTPLADIARTRLNRRRGTLYLKLGRKLARISAQWENQALLA